MPRPQGLTRSFAALPATGALHARRALHATNVALHEPKAPYPQLCCLTHATGALHARRALHATNVALHAPSAPYTQPPAALRYLMIFTSPSSPILMMLLGWWGWCSWRRVQQT